MEKIFICGFILSSIFVEFKLVILCFSVIGGLKLIMKTALSWSLSSPTIGYNLSIWLKHHMNSILIVKNFTLIDPVQNKNDFTLQEDTYWYCLYKLTFVFFSLYTVTLTCSSTKPKAPNQQTQLFQALLAFQHIYLNV